MIRKERHVTTTSAITAFAALGIAASGCAMDELDVGSNQAPMSFEEFEATVYQEPWSGVYIVNGDTPLETREQLREFYHSYFVDGELIVNRVGGSDDKWSDSQKLNITYCVSQSSFGSRYARTVAAMETATQAWEAAANVNFIHDSSKDGSCTNKTSGVVFDVRMVSTSQYLARAFFPSTSRKNRNVLISTSSYAYDNDPSDPLKLEGVLRHELGHALGFRHEHTRPEAGVCFEDTSWRELTSYDSASVMHYPQCNGSGDWSLVLTSRDRQGAAALYGAPGSGSGGGDGGGDDGGDDGGVCLPKGDSCTANSDCCSGKCGGPPHNRTCRN